MKRPIRVRQETAESFRPANARMQLALSQHESFPYVVELGGLKFIVLKGVFSPRYFDSTAFFVESLPYKSGSSILEIGSGTGILSVFAALRKAKHVIAVDVNEQAVLNTKINILLHGVSSVVTAKKGDIFSTVANMRFHQIFWNYPWVHLPKTTPVATVLAKSLFDPGYGQLSRLFKTARRYLEKDGAILLGFGNTGDYERLNDLSDLYGYSVQEIASGISALDSSYSYDLLELRATKEYKIRRARVYVV